MTGRMAAVVLLFAPVVFLLATSVPADMANHRGETLRGVATVTAVESVRGGTMATYAVTSEAGEPVGSTDDVYGLDGETVGQSYPVNYVAPDAADKQVAAYAIGEDPLFVNLAVLAVAGIIWLGSVGYVTRRVLRWIPRRTAHEYRATGQYQVEDHRG